MEEKERYEIHIYDDICVDLYDNGVLDNSINDTYKLEELLNQQSKRLKEFEQENQKLKQQLAITEKALELACDLIKCISTVAKSYSLEEPNCKVKDVEYFKQQAKEMLENERMIERNFEEKYKQKCNEILALKDSYEYALAELKQQLHDLPKKIVEEIRDDMSKRIIEKQIKWGDNIQIGFICNAINECLDTILKKYGDKNESNND